MAAVAAGRAAVAAGSTAESAAAMASLLAHLQALEYSEPLGIESVSLVQRCAGRAARSAGGPTAARRR
jgi:hypothetical protein